MPITSVDKDLDALTLTVVADFPVPVRRLWDAYADPRQIERFWGPVGWPATFTRHDMAPGGRSAYYMTGPDGERSGGFRRQPGEPPEATSAVSIQPPSCSVAQCLHRTNTWYSHTVGSYILPGYKPLKARCRQIMLVGLRVVFRTP